MELFIILLCGQYVVLVLETFELR